MSDKIKSNILVCLSDSGHVSMLEKSDELHSATRKFLKTEVKLQNKILAYHKE